MTAGTLPPLVADRVALALAINWLEHAGVRIEDDGTAIAEVAILAGANRDRAIFTARGRYDDAAGVLVDALLDAIAWQIAKGGELVAAATDLQAALGSLVDPTKATAVIRAAAAVVAMYRADRGGADHVFAACRALGEALDAAGVSPCG